MSQVLMDSLNKRVNLGDVVVYGANSGLRIGIIVKFNPKTFQIRIFKNQSYPSTINVPYGYKNCLARVNSITELDVEAELNADELHRIEIDRKIRSHP